VGGVPCWVRNGCDGDGSTVGGFDQGMVPSFVDPNGRHLLYRSNGRVGFLDKPLPFHRPGQRLLQWDCQWHGRASAGGEPCRGCKERGTAPCPRIGSTNTCRRRPLRGPIWAMQRPAATAPLALGCCRVRAVILRLEGGARDAGREIDAGRSGARLPAACMRLDGRCRPRPSAVRPPPAGVGQLTPPSLSASSPRGSRPA
jgi:hypothetical protein